MALEYLLPCKCGQETPVSESLAGMYVTCACGRSVRVPARSRLFELRPAPVMTAVAAIPVKPAYSVKPADPAMAADRGLELPKSSEPLSTKSGCCPQCGAAATNPQAKFCWLCGASMGQAARLGEASSSASVPSDSSLESGCLTALLAFLAGLAVAALVVYAMIASFLQTCSQLLGGGR